MPINFIEDIKSITDLKLHTTSVLDQVKRTKTAGSAYGKRESAGSAGRRGRIR